jgi:hypothetical protein
VPVAEHGPFASLATRSRCVKGAFYHEGHGQVECVELNTNTNVVKMPPYDTTRFFIPYYVRFPYEGASSQTYLLDESRGASFVYLYGYINTGDSRCTHCIKSGSYPFLACANAPGICWGICATCLLAGGSPEEIMARCDIRGHRPFEDMGPLGEEGVFRGQDSKARGEARSVFYS